MRSDGICTRIYVVVFLTAELLWREVCIYLFAAGCKPLRLQHYQAQREMASLVLLNGTVHHVRIYFVRCHSR